jgi:hypothetical protein
VSWSPLQYEALEAMGLSPLRLAGADVAGANVAESTSTASASKAGAPASTIRDPSPKAEAMDAMTAALLRAAGLSADIGGNEVLALCPVPQSLRGDARAKRALWPHLRAMRKG